MGKFYNCPVILLRLLNNELKYDGIRVKYNDVKILEPVAPSKVINFGWTYAEHAKETGGKANLQGTVFVFKTNNCLDSRSGRNHSSTK